MVWWGYLSTRALAPLPCLTEVEKVLIPRRLTHFRCAVLLPVLIGTVACSSGDTESTDANGVEVLAVSGETGASTNTVLAGGTVPFANTQQSTALNSVLVVPTTVSTQRTTPVPQPSPLVSRHHRVQQNQNQNQLQCSMTTRSWLVTTREMHVA